ncbi:alanine racemase C-terminal domain-containing protein [Bradyrhizobium sp. Leo170]|uniref:alanine racemase C-terminal domain-containing protein n=1 Tax=Bradyrhizobium sp. Leo170 TaxID=1571199 RepID=UPI00102EA1E8|nr:alanine racemase C-terminal domain-containing protein [Bradyrhizobium sp. Leo170]
MTSRHLRLEGVYGHPMTSYGFEDESYLLGQLRGFKQAITAIEAAGIAIPIRMVSSSAIVLGYPEADWNAVDPGRLVVGMSFPAVEERKAVWRPALVGLKSRLVLVKSLAEIGAVYPAPFLPLRPQMRIGLIPIGWSDGYPHRMPEGATALIRGQRVRLLGPSHSELLRVDLSDISDAAIGDEVVLLGQSGEDAIGLTELADQWGVTTRDLFPIIGKTLPHRYFG